MEEGEQSRTKPTLITAIIILAVVIAAISGYFIWRNFSATPEERAAEALDKATGVGVLPTINPINNPVEELPTTNPLDQTNPFNKTYSNPFK